MRQKMHKLKNDAKSFPNDYVVESIILPEFIVPYYINTSRLTDLYAIQNGGYSEYSEFSLMEKNHQGRRVEGEIDASAKLFVVGGISGQGKGNWEKGVDTESIKNEKIVQTAATMLKSILNSGNIENIANHDEDGCFLTEKEIMDSTGLICLKGTLTKLDEQPDTTSNSNSEGNYFWKRKIKKMYDQFNGIPDRAPVILNVPLSISKYSESNFINDSPAPELHLNAILSKGYLYQCQLDDMWDVDFICLGRIMAHKTQPRIEIVALF